MSAESVRRDIKKILSNTHPYTISEPLGSRIVEYPSKADNILCEAEIQAQIYARLISNKIDARLEVKTAINRIDIVIYDKHRTAVLAVEVKDTTTTRSKVMVVVGQVNGKPKFKAIKKVGHTRQRERYSELSIPTYYATGNGLGIVEKHVSVIEEIMRVYSAG